jgi:hypothetical protein
MFYRNSPICSRIPYVCARLFDVHGIAVKAMNNKAFINSERFCQLAVSTTQMNDTTAFYAGCVEYLFCSFVVVVRFRPDNGYHTYDQKDIDQLCENSEIIHGQVSFNLDDKTAQTTYPAL